MSPCLYLVRILYSPSTSTSESKIVIYGYSYGFGRADHEISMGVVMGDER